MDQQNLQKYIFPSSILGLSLIVGVIIFSAVFYNIKAVDNALSVTGSAKSKITSDVVKWTGNFSQTVPAESLKVGHQRMKSDQEKVIKFLKDNKIGESDFTISPVMMENYFQYNPGAPKEYVLRQNLEVKSGEVEKLTSLAKNVQSLIDQGVVFSTLSVEYYYSRLAEARINLLSEAVKDAKIRADKIAESTGRSTGSIRSASMGVVQVLPVNSVEVSDYGAYDTSSIEKEIMVTVKAVFVID